MLSVISGVMLYYCALLLVALFLPSSVHAYCGCVCVVCEPLPPPCPPPVICPPPMPCPPPIPCPPPRPLICEPIDPCLAGGRFPIAGGFSSAGGGGYGGRLAVGRGYAGGPRFQAGYGSGAARGYGGGGYAGGPPAEFADRPAGGYGAGPTRLAVAGRLSGEAQRVTGRLYGGAQRVTGRLYGGAQRVTGGLYGGAQRVPPAAAESAAYDDLGLEAHERFAFRGGVGGPRGGLSARPSSGYAASGGYPTGRAKRSVLSDLSLLKPHHNETAFNDPLCNSSELRRIMEETISNDTTESKLAIQRAAEQKMQKSLNVMCAKSDFAFFAYTETFCQTTKASVTCYAF